MLLEKIGEQLALTVLVVGIMDVYEKFFDSHSSHFRSLF